MRPAELPRTFALKCIVKTSRSGKGSAQRRRRSTVHQLSQQARSTNVQTMRSGSGSAQRTEAASNTAGSGDSRPVLRAAAERCQVGRHGTQNPGWWALAAPMAFHPGAVLAGRRCSMVFSPPQQAAGLWAFVGLPLSLSDTDAGAPSQHRSGHVHPEQELWGRNCAVLLGACAEGRAEETTLGVAE